MSKSSTVVTMETKSHSEPRDPKFEFRKSFQMIMFLLLCNIVLILFLIYYGASREENAEVRNELTDLQILTILNDEMETPNCPPLPNCSVSEPVECPSEMMKNPPVAHGVSPVAPEVARVARVVTPEMELVQTEKQYKMLTAQLQELRQKIIAQEEAVLEAAKQQFSATVHLYSDSNFEGDEFTVTFDGNVGCFDLPFDLDKVTSSLEVTGKCVLLYREQGCVGMRDTIRTECNATVPFLEEFDNQISSLQIASDAQNVAYWSLYEEWSQFKFLV